MGYLLSILFLLWLISFIYNCIHFFRHDDSEIDSVFINKSKTFSEAKEKLIILGNHTKKEFKSAHRKLSFYENNAKKTRRKYAYYSDKIEPFFLKVLVGKRGSLFKNCWRLLDTSVKFHYLFLYAVLAIVLVVVIVALIASFSFYAIPLFLLVLIFFIRFSGFIIKLNFVFFYLLLDGILIIFKQDRGNLYKNIALLGVINSRWLGSNSGNSYVLAAGGAIAYNDFGGNGDFGGFGGGDFGGGGAGGSW